ncbi:MAG: translocation/assembly module TamB, partial [Sphingomonadales bacterium]|nr:translocation/assembly module TamB [Sphingomonadales bacterium]
MSDDATPDDYGPPPRPAHRLWIGRFLVGALLVVAVLLATAALLDTQMGHRFVADRIAAQRPANGLRYSVGRIEGSLYGKARLIDVRLRDPDGLVLQVPRAELDWRPFALIAERLDIRSLVIPQATLHKLPRTLDTGRRGPILPRIDIAIGELRIDRLDIAPAVTGVARSGSVNGSATIRSGRAMVRLDAVVQGSDRLRLILDAEPDRNRFDVDLSARGTSQGVLARLTGIARPLAAEVQGTGDWRQWRGTARMDAGNARIVDLALANDAGRYALSGSLAPASLVGGKLQRLSAPRILVNGAATLERRRIDGSLSLRSPAISLEATGEIDLAASRFRNVRIAGRLLRPPALFPNMTGRDIQLRAIVDGAFASAAVDYRLTAAQVQFDATGFETVRAAGRLRLSDPPVIVPVDLTAARVTGVGDVAGGILRNLRVTGPLRVTARELTGDGLVLRSDQLNGRITLFLDLRTGRYEVGLSGGLRRYLIPGIGLVDVESRLTVVPGPGGVGTRV